MRKTAPLKPTFRKAQCKPFEAQGKRVRHPTSKPVRGGMLRFALNQMQVTSMRYPSTGSYTSKNRTLKIEGCGTQTPNQFVPEWYASTRSTPEVRNGVGRPSRRDPSLTLFAQDDNCWPSGCSALRAELVGQVDCADRDHVEISGLSLIRFPGAAVAEFIGTINESGSETAATRGL